MELLSDIIEENLYNMKLNNELSNIWRGNIGNDDWKIIINSRDYSYSNIDIKLKRRKAVVEEGVI